MSNCNILASINSIEIEIKLKVFELDNNYFITINIKDAQLSALSTRLFNNLPIDGTVKSKETVKRKQVM